MKKVLLVCLAVSFFPWSLQAQMNGTSPVEPIPRIISPNGGEVTYVSNITVVVDIDNMNDSGGTLSVSATGGQFTTSAAYLATREIPPNFKGRMSVLLSAKELSLLKDGVPYVLEVQTADKKYGSHVPNTDKTDKPIILKRIYKNPASETVASNATPFSVKSLSKSADVVKGGKQGLYKFNFAVTAPKNEPLYIPQKSGFLLGARRTEGVTLDTPTTIKKTVVVGFTGAKKVRIKGETFYRISTGETGLFKVNFSYSPVYKGDYYAYLYAMRYMTSKGGVVSNAVDLDQSSTQTNDVFIDGAEYDSSVEEKG